MHVRKGLLMVLALMVPSSIMAKAYPKFISSSKLSVVRNGQATNLSVMNRGQRQGRGKLIFTPCEHYGGKDDVDDNDFNKKNHKIYSRFLKADPKVLKLQAGRTKMVQLSVRKEPNKELCTATYMKTVGLSYSKKKKFLSMPSSRVISTNLIYVRPKKLEPGVVIRDAGAGRAVLEVGRNSSIKVFQGKPCKFIKGDTTSCMSVKQPDLYGIYNAGMGYDITYNGDFIDMAKTLSFSSIHDAAYDVDIKIQERSASEQQADVRTTL